MSFLPLIPLFAIASALLWSLAAYRRNRDRRLLPFVALLACLLLLQALLAFSPKLHIAAVETALNLAAAVLAASGMAYALVARRLPAIEAMSDEMLDSLPGGILLVSPDGAVLRANREARQFLNLTWDEATRRYLTDPSNEFFADDGNRVGDLEMPAHRCLETQQPQPALALTLRRKGLGTRCGIFRAVPYESPTLGRRPGALITFMDATQEAEKDRLLRENEVRFQFLFEACPDGISIHKDGLRVYVNSAYLRMFGYSDPSEVLGKTLLPSLGPDGRVMTGKDLEKMVNEHADNLAPVPVTRKDGSTFTMDARVARYQFQGEAYIVGFLRDVSGRQRTEEALRHSEEKYRAVVEQMVEGVFLYDCESYKIFESNFALQHLLGYTATELKEMTLFDIIAHDRASILSNLDIIIRQRIHFIGERKYKAKDGRFLDAEVVANLIEYGGRRMICVIVRPLSQQKKAEEALRKAREQLSLVVTQTPAHLYFLDKEGIFTLSEGKGLDALGFKPGQLVGSSVFEMYQDLPEVTAAFRRALKGDSFRSRLEMAGRIYETVHTPLLGEDGSIQGTTGLALDMTEQVKAQRALQESEERYKGLAEVAFDGIAIHQDGSFRLVNQAFADIFGLKPAELVGRNILEVTGPDSIAEVKARLQGQQDGSFEMIGLHKDGSPLNLELSVKNCHYQGRPARLAAARDITQKRKTQEVLIKQTILYESLFQAQSDLDEGFGVSEGQKLVYVNEALCRISGYSEEELLGNSPFEFLVPAAQAVMEDRLKKRLAGLEEGAVYETVLRHKGGHTVELELSIKVMENRGPGASRVLFIARDVTEKVRARIGLIAKEEQYRLLFETNPNPMLVVDPASGSILAANDAATRLYGYTREEFLKRGLADLKGAKAPASPQPLEAGIHRHLRKDGSEMLVDMAAGPTLFHGHEAKILSLHDETDRKKAEASLSKEVMLNADILQAQGELGEGFFIFENGKVTLANPAACAIVGYTEEELRALPRMTDLFLPGERDKLADRLTRRLAGEAVPDHYETAVLRKDGGRADVEVSLKLEKEGPGYRMVGLVRDISERRESQLALRESEERYKGLVEVAFDGVAIHQDGAVRFANRAFEEMLGCPPSGSTGRRLSEFILAEYRPLMQHKVDSGDETPYEVIGQRSNGTRLYLELCTRACRYQGQPAHITAMRDISDRKHAEETIRYHAYHDPLTGLPNRLLFYDHLSLELAHAAQQKRMMAVLFLDLDRLKNINDQLGHDVGDKLIKAVAQRLTSALKEGDTVARLGGDEFTILLPLLNSSEDAVKAARKLLEVVQPPFLIDGHEIHVTVSIGISLFPNDGKDAETLLKNADAALYRAKEQGRNTNQLYTASLNARTLTTLGMENSLRHAVGRQELVLHYQPQVELDGGSICGLEALIRWRHPDLGLIFPEQFIPLAEESGMIMAIGEWVLREACRQSQAWAKAGLKIPRLAVNLSARQFEKRDLAATIARILKEEKMDPEGLELEITESIAMRDTEYTSRILRVLKKLGVHIAMDDFGTGHSSLSYLKKFPFDTLKVDRSFIRELHTSHYDKAIIKAVIVVAQNMNLRVVAEGVETIEQLAYLKQEGCQSIQGYLFSRPVPAEAITEMIQKSAKLLV